MRFVRLESEVQNLRAEIAALKEKTATTEYVSGQIAIITLKIENLHGDLTTIKNAAYAIVAMVATGLIGGVLALLFKPGLFP